ncbi:protease [Chitinophaga oryzae]|uniref:Protease n=1 Tax=Chitinophaga oryzae TaxID=2725414 RepID=A0AAE6ZJZ7_9BACT|nr:M57 family metalloprotease [Chitinophaga oryzae]QJB32794.1 protease [Chitinophaga oryzae]QJB39247.1 protease [Chitinophaga oryzae]
MKRQIAVIACLAAGLMMGACNRNDQQKEAQPNPVSDEVLAQIKALGFGTSDVQKRNGGYLVEGDILLTADQLNQKVGTPTLRIAKDEQYRTNNLVTALPRVVTIKVTDLGAAYIAGTDTAIARYNRLGLRLTFQRITSGDATITIKGFSEGVRSDGFITLGYAGFPTDDGNPYDTITMNTHSRAYGANPDILYVGSVIQHELGHCIGMRHTDYMRRTYSCKGDPVRNEGDGGVGAVHIDGTPTRPDAESWMLACSNGGNRTFNANDIIALNFLYQ